MQAESVIFAGQTAGSAKSFPAADPGPQRPAEQGVLGQDAGEVAPSGLLRDGGALGDVVEPGQDLGGLLA